MSQKKFPLPKNFFFFNTYIYTALSLLDLVFLGVCGEDSHGKCQEGSIFWLVGGSLSSTTRENPADFLKKIKKK